MTVSPSRGALRRMTKGLSSGAVGRGRATGCRSGTAGARPAAFSRCAASSSWRHVAAIGVAALEQLVRDLGVAGLELRLEIFVRRPSRARASRSPSRIASIAAWVERALSVSSIRSRNLPPWWRANSQLNSAVRAPPMCRKPVGEGAKRVTTDCLVAILLACAQARFPLVCMVPNGMDERP